MRNRTLKQERFIEAMADPRTKSQTEAAIKAGCPPKSARITASKWLTNTNISAAIEDRKRRAIAHSRTTPEEVLGAAVFNMRSSMDDLLDESGSFDIEKARATGAIDLIKKHKETVRTIVTKNGSETIKTVEVELESPAAARREVAGYMGLEKMPAPNPQTLTTDDFARELVRRLVAECGWEPELALKAAREQYPLADVKLLTDGAGPV